MSRSIDLTASTPADRAICFGEAFRDVQMVKQDICADGQMMTTVTLEGAQVLLVGDPLEALAGYYLPRHAGQRYPCDGGGTVAYSTALFEKGMAFVAGLKPSRSTKS